MVTARIDQIMARLDAVNPFRTISRIQYTDYNMADALEIVEKMGKMRKPTFVIDDENQFVFENLIRWVHADPEMKCINPATKEIIPGRLNAGIYIAGNTGTGKSWALEIMSAYCLIDNVMFRINKELCPLRWENIRTDSICDKYATEGIYNNYTKLKVLGMQDFGTEEAESMYMGNRIHVIRKIVETRGDFQDRITLFSSNIPMKHKSVTEKYGDRVASRLEEMCNYFELKGKDRRKL